MIYRVYAVDQDKNVLGQTNWESLNVSKAYADIQYSGLDKISVGQESYIGPKDAVAYIYDKDNDGSDPVDLLVSSARFTDSAYGSISFSEEFEGWVAVPKKAGKASIEVEFVYADDPDTPFEYTFTTEIDIVKQVEGIGVWYDNEEGIFPGDEVNLVASPGDEVTLPENAEYEWSITGTSNEKDCTLTVDQADNSKAVLSIPDDFGDGNVEIKLVVRDGADGEIFDYSQNTVEVCTKKYKFFYEGFDDALAPGEFMTITPVLKVKSAADQEFSELDGTEKIYIDVYLDDDGDNKVYENEIAAIKANDNGSYEITRKTNDFQSIHFLAYTLDKNEEGEDTTSIIWHQEDYLQQYDYRVELEGEETLFKESTLDIAATGIEGEGFTYEFALSKCTGIGKNEDGDDTLVFESMDNSDNSLFTTNGNTVTLNGAAVWEAVKDGYVDEDYDCPRVELSVSVKKNGNEVASDDMMIDVREATKYYDVEADAECLLNSSYLVDYEHYDGELLDAEHPGGLEFSYTVTGVSVADTTIAKVRKNDEDECWDILGLKAGTTDLTFRITDEFGDTDTVTAKLTVTTDIYSLELDSDAEDALPGDKVSFTADGEHWNYKADNELFDFTYKWNIDPDSEEYVDTVTPNKNKVDITLSKDILTEDKEYEEVHGTVELIDKNGNKQREATFCISIRNSITVFYPTTAELCSKNMPLNTNITVKPRVVERSFVDGAQKAEEITDFKWLVSYDSEEFQIKNSAGKIVQPEDENNLQKGTFTIRRLSPDYVSFNISYYLRDEESEEEDTYIDADNNYYDYEALEPIKEATVSNIKNYYFTGKARTQAPKVNYWGTVLKLGRDYKLAYKNNKNVGLATVSIIGIGDYYGTINKTYRINPKGTVLSKLTAAKKAFTVKWKKQATKMATSPITGYQIQYSLNSKFKTGNKLVTVKGYTNLSKKISKLKAKKVYYVRIRTYKTVSKKNYYSGWSKTMKVKTK